MKNFPDSNFESLFKNMNIFFIIAMILSVIGIILGFAFIGTIIYFLLSIDLPDLSMR